MAAVLKGVDAVAMAPRPLAEVPLASQWARGRRTHARQQVVLPPQIEAAVWRGSELGSPVSGPTVPSGHAALDVELPGGGWPCQSITEILHAQPGTAEWRLLGPALARQAAAGGQVVVVGPPRMPHLPGLRLAGLDERRLVWIKADSPAERLWVTEQLVKANSCGAVIAWVQARQEQVRRLQVCALGCDGLVFLCRPLLAEHEPSAAPLRLKLRVGVDWALQVELFKRRGPAHEGVISLESVPSGLAPLLTPRLRTPSALIAARQRRPNTVSADRVAGAIAAADAVPLSSTLEPITEGAADAVGSPASRRELGRRAQTG